MRKIVLVLLALIFLTGCFTKNTFEENTDNIKDTLNSIDEQRVNTFEDYVSENNQNIAFDATNIRVKIQESKDVFLAINNMDDIDHDYSITTECKSLGSEDCFATIDFLKTAKVSAKEMKIIPVTVTGLGQGTSIFNFTVKDDFNNEYKEYLRIEIQ